MSGRGKSKSFIIQQDAHLLTVIRYVLRNPVRAGLVTQVLDWPWASLRVSHVSDPIPVDTPSDWLHWLGEPLFDHELEAVRTCVNRQQPFGTDSWRSSTALGLGLESTLRKRGRPFKHLAK